MAQIRDNMRNFVNMLMNFQVPENDITLLAS
jgi:hypothetical protein